MRQEEIAQSLVKIKIKEGVYQSGFLFTDFGHILTTGHGIINNKMSTEETVLVKFEDDPNSLSYTAKVIECVNSPKNYLDYAVLKIANPEFYERAYFKATIDSYKPKIQNGKDVILVGYAKNLDQQKANLFKGRIFGAHPVTSTLSNRKNHWIQLKIDTKQSFSGMSGAPVIIGGKIIGIQNSQAKFDNGDCYATPINCIRLKLIEDEIKDGNNFFYNNPIFFAGSDIKKIKSTSQKKIRNILFLCDFQNPTENIIINSIKDKRPLTEFHRICSEVLSQLKPLLRNNISEVEFRMIATSKDDVKNLQATLKSYENAIDQFSTYLRCLLYTGDHTADRTYKISNEKEISNSHIVGIEAKKSNKNKILALSKLDFDIFFLIEYSDEEFAIDNIRKILFGIMIDISYFWTVLGMKMLFPQTQSQKSFSLRKVSFAESKGLALFGNVKIPESTSYISFAWLVQNTKENYSKFEKFKYHNLWKSFFSGRFGLFAHVQGPNSAMSGMFAGEVIETMKAHKKIYGQLSISRLRQKLEELDSQIQTQIYAIVILVKRPHIRDRNKIKLHLGSYKLKSLAVVPLDKIAPFMTFSHLLDFYYFIKKV